MARTHPSRSLFRIASAAMVVAAISLSLPVHGQRASDIVVGMSAALSGPSAQLGRGVRLGIDACFKRINEAGGIGGRMLRLVALDDSYQADPVKNNMLRLIDQEKVLAVIGNVGTAGAGVAVPIANERKVLFFGAFSGADLLRKQPPDRYVINLRASYAEETGVMVRGLFKRGIKPEQIAFFTQNDGYGDSGFAGAIQAIKALGYADMKFTHGRYERGTLDVEDAVLEIVQAKSRPRAVIMVGAYAATAKFVKLAKQVVPNATFLSVSFVGATALTEALDKDGEGVIVTQVVPHPDADLPGVAEYRSALRHYAPDARLDVISLEGYLTAKAFVEGLRRVRGELTRESIIDAIERAGALDIGIGVPLKYSPTEHQGSHHVWLTVMRGGKLVSFDE